MKLQCGYEDDCKCIDCFHCKRFLKFKPKFKALTLAESTCIEDFSVIDMKSWLKEKPKDLELSQDIMRRLMKKIDWS